MKCPKCNDEMKYFNELTTGDTELVDGYKCPSCGTIHTIPVVYMSDEDEEEWRKMAEETIAYYKRHPKRDFMGLATHLAEQGLSVPQT